MVHRGDLSRIQLWFSSTSHKPLSILLSAGLSPEYTTCKQNPCPAFSWNRVNFPSSSRYGVMALIQYEKNVETH